MVIKAHFQTITLLETLEISLESGDIVAFVGPNNVGKSQALRDIAGTLTEEARTRQAVSKIEIVFDDDLETVASKLSPYKTDGVHYRFGNQAIQAAHLSMFYNSTTNRHVFGPLLLSDLQTRQRLIDCDPQGAVNSRDIAALTHPFHHMMRDTSIEREVSRLFRRAFNQDLVMLRAMGTNFSGYIGQRPDLLPGETEIDGSYLDRVENVLRPLDKEGDGVRSYASIVSRLVTEKRSFQLIDEPEAFLHPPQARKIGLEIGTHSGGRQTFIATHSQDVLQGLISSAPKSVHVVRLSRTNEKRTARHIASADIANLWQDHILRYSDVLDGLFHDGVVVAESDHDCRFYQAVMEVATDDNRPDLHYVHVNGKSRMHSVIAALTRVGVPVAAIFDFDLLNAEQPLRKTIEAAGGKWSDFVDDWKAISTAVNDRKSYRDAPVIRAELQRLAKAVPGSGPVSKALLSEIRAAAKDAQPWDSIREVGLAGLKPLKCVTTGSRLLQNLADLGIFVVPVGQMEGFDPEEEAEKGAWVNAVLETDLNRVELGSARDFCKKIADWIMR